MTTKTGDDQKDVERGGGTEGTHPSSRSGGLTLESKKRNHRSQVFEPDPVRCKMITSSVFEEWIVREEGTQTKRKGTDQHPSTTIRILDIDVFGWIKEVHPASRAAMN